MAQHSKNSYPAEVKVEASHLVKVKKCISPPHKFKKNWQKGKNTQRDKNLTIQYKRP